ncbi:helix-turn-helix domain containing protein [Candidatus Termititenax persephonae]|uniref:Helix-turn-helix domain containing protein n=1 Tax=Candidatus Termititenax persephonae TaxID=2218525 RepID=A0A388TG11_9BACT|nr:helix-turn-helix domain containing protein [Candidatus Termititenax persephonae]
MSDSQELQELCAILAKCCPKLSGEFLRAILTPNELRELCQRWRIIKMLAAGKAQREIAQTLKTSLCKITRGSRELQKKNSPLLQALQIRKQLRSQ